MSEEQEKIIYKNEVFVREETDLFNGFRPLSGYKKADPTFAWKGPKMDLNEWRKALAFMAWVNKHDKSEAQLRFIVLKDKIAVWAFPQEKNSGMTTKEIQNQAQIDQTKEFIDQGGMMFGTVHSHCDSKAFQSGTDSSDEVNQDGMHITIGCMSNKDSYDIHHRFYYYGVKYNLSLADWFDIGDDMRAKLAEASALTGVAPGKIFERIITSPLDSQYIDSDEAFPQEWKENLIEVPRSNYSVGMVNRGVQHRGPSGGDYNKIIVSNGKYKVTEASLQMLLGKIIKNWNISGPVYPFEQFKDAAITTLRPGNMMMSELAYAFRGINQVFPNQFLTSITPVLMAHDMKTLDKGDKALLNKLRKLLKPQKYDDDAIRTAVSAFIIADTRADEVIASQSTWQGDGTAADMSDGMFQRAQGMEDSFHNGVPDYVPGANGQHHGCFS